MDMQYGMYKRILERINNEVEQIHPIGGGTQTWL